MSLFDLSHVVRSLASEVITVTRLTAGTYDADGRVVAKSAETIFDTWASVQPTSGTDLMKFPEGDDPSDFITVHSTQELRPQDEILTARGTYEVLKVRYWGDSGSWWKAVARKRNEAEL